MKVYLSGWESKGLRCPDMDIHIPLPKRGQVNLIQMPNGTGKSTIIDLITAILSQKQFAPKEIAALRSQDSPSAVGEFWLKI